ncbi:unnamed protein product [Ilex paraguariensis]|uniref:Uncharacterized protein n=1 Tax=Ilex paraguariensis TaxID=185542 RepID=A0ABC8RMT4_9AQUA
MSCTAFLTQIPPKPPDFCRTLPSFYPSQPYFFPVYQNLHHSTIDCFHPPKPSLPKVASLRAKGDKFSKQNTISVSQQTPYHAVSNLFQPLIHPLYLPDLIVCITWL